MQEIPLTPKARRTREALLAAGRKLLGRDGVAAINVMTICAEAGVGRTSFYSYFDDVDTLIGTILSDMALTIRSRFNSLHQDQPRGVERLEACLRMVLELARNEPETVLLLTSLAEHTPFVEDLLKQEIAEELKGNSERKDQWPKVLVSYLAVTTLAVSRRIAMGQMPEDEPDQVVSYLLAACGR